MTVQQSEKEFLKSEPGQEPVIVEGLFRANPARVFRAFTEPDEVQSWFVPKSGGLVSVDIDLKVGGKWCFVIEKTPEKQIHFEGEYLAIDAPNRLEFSWRHGISRIAVVPGGFRPAQNAFKKRGRLVEIGNS